MSDVAMPRERMRPEMSGPVLGMVLFVASEAMFFAAFFGGYFTIRANAPAWPPPDVPHLKIDIATILTVVLVASSVAVQLSLRATRAGRRRPALWWLGATIALGFVVRRRHRAPASVKGARCAPMHMRSLLIA